VAFLFARLYTEAHGGSSDGPIKLNIAGCSLRHDPRIYPQPPPLEDPARESEGGMGAKAGGGKSTYKRVVAPPPVLPKAIVPGLYRCDLADVGGRLAAAMLCEAREAQGPQVWRRVTLDGTPVSDAVAALWPEALPPPNDPGRAS